MTDKQDAVAALKQASQACTDALITLSSASPAATASDTPDTPPLATLHADLDVLLSLIYSSTTKLALALNPVQAAYRAALAPLRDVRGHAPALAICAARFGPHGGTLATVVTQAVRAAVEALRDFLACLETGGEGEEYMRRAATVHDLLDRARARPRDNASAVKARWNADHDAMDDALREVAEVVADAGKDTDEDVDEGWDELGLGSGRALDAEELERAKAVHTVLRLTILLHGRIIRDLFASASPAALDALTDISVTLQERADDLASALYTGLGAELSAFVECVHTLQNSVEPLLPDELAEGVQNMTLAPDVPQKKPIDKRKWFQTCFTQIHKASGRVDAASAPSNGNPTPL